MLNRSFPGYILFISVCEELLDQRYAQLQNVQNGGFS